MWTFIGLVKILVSLKEDSSTFLTPFNWALKAFLSDSKHSFESTYCE
jgi:hypothetical protein